MHYRRPVAAGRIAGLMLLDAVLTSQLNWLSTKGGRWPGCGP
jgi:hypothetical protein